MKLGLGLVASTQVVASFSFSPTSKQLRNPTQIHSAATSEEVVVNTKVPVTRISVCAGELCQCQGEEFEYTGGASDAAIQELRQLDLKFPIDEVGCLGACGMGTMIAIDYENGDSIMTDGLESTLTELGISAKTQLSTDESVQSSDNVEAAASSIVADDATSKTVATKKKPSAKELVDVRERMRQETAVVEVENPWLKMGSYLAKKATDKLFGSE